MSGALGSGMKKEDLKIVIIPYIIWDFEPDISLSLRSMQYLQEHVHKYHFSIELCRPPNYLGQHD